MRMMYPKDATWLYALESEFKKSYYKNLMLKLEEAYNQGKEVYPNQWAIFKALDLCPPYQAKVLILGQDPYPQPGMASGLAFSCSEHTDSKKLPASLKNIFRALKADTGIDNKYYNLDYWGAQGVILLNSILTVERGRPLSHKDWGWEQFTDSVISYLNEYEKPMVFCLWGDEARKKKDLITNEKHLILESSHPSGQSAHKGFLFCKHFSKINKFLHETGQLPVNWRL